ncbi:MAG: hypothetical protein COB33_007510 [Thiotrichaceae bacterium]|nr:hypothetical protein [Thiotrichaceae bacterium]
MKFPCPKCEQPGISPKNKYRAGYMQDTFCAHCNVRLSANPWFLVPFSLIYMWVLAVCTFLYVFDGAGMMALLYGVIGWLVVDALNVLLIPMIEMDG